MEQKIKIRRAVESDYTDLNLLYHYTYSFIHKNIPESYHSAPDTVLAKGDFYNILDDKKCYMLVAEMGGKVVGMIFAEIDDRDDTPVAAGYHRVEINELSVLPAYSKQGIGTRLMREAEKWAEEQGIVDLSVLTHDFNKEAIEFYKSNGYKPYSIKMEKKLK